MASLRRDDVAVFLRQAEGTAKILGTKVEQFSHRLRLTPRRPSGVYATCPAPPPDAEPAGFVEEPGTREADLELAAEELQVQQDQLELACELLERERAKYIDLFEQSPDAYVATDTGGAITNANIAAGALFGVEPGQLEGRPLISFVARQDTRSFRQHLRELKGAPDVRTMTLRMRPRRGDVFVVAMCVRVVRGLRGKPIAFRCTLRKSDVPAAGVSWLDQVVALSAKDRASVDEVDLAEHIERASNAVRSAAAARNVRIVLDSERRSRVRSQATDLQRLLDLVLSGTVAATPNNGELRVRVVVEGDEVLLDVTPWAENACAPTIRIRLRA